MFADTTEALRPNLKSGFHESLAEEWVWNVFLKRQMHAVV